VAINEDPPSFWDVATGGVGSGGGRALLPAVNQFLAVVGADGAAHPRLLAELPSVERGSWRLLPDGGMETTWNLRPGVAWQDGAPFTSDDITFSVEFNRDPEVANSNRAAVSAIARVETPDPTTAVVSWGQVYPFADRLSDREFVPVARHQVERAYRDSKETVLLQPFWNTEWVGLGPYRIGRWERGSSLELVAFDSYFLGRPRIDTIRVQFIPEQRTLVANLLARTLNTALPPGGGDFESLLIVRREWEAAGYGTTLPSSEFWTFIDPQKLRNPQPPDLVDPRVRRALLLALDREQLVGAMYGELGIVGDSWLHPRSPRYQQLAGSITHFTHDPRRAVELLAETGWQRGADGALMKAGQRFDLKIRFGNDERLAAVLADQWKAVGVRSEHDVLSPQAQRDRMARATFTGVDTTSNPMVPYAVQRRFASASIPMPEGSWAGVNSGGYSSAEWDTLAERFLTSLDEQRRLDVERELLRVLATDLPALPLTFNLQLTPVGGGLTGVQPITGVPHQGTILYAWNIHEWDLR
jgi:peptide/nickel transport system substrate-binding protein